MVSVDKIYNTFVENGVDFFTGVPDSLLADMCAYITDNSPADRHIIAANEGAAVGIASGYYMASGKVPLVYMQNSGIGNAINPLLSLADEKVYSIPVLLMIGWRGEPGTKDEPQHLKQGEVTLALLDAMDIPYTVLSNNESEALSQLKTIIKKTLAQSAPQAIIIRKGTFGKYQFAGKAECEYPLTREEALKIVVDTLGERDVTVSTTGKLSRELFEYREEKRQGHARDFLTVGSMGHSCSIALGIAMEKRERHVYCLDGDGAFIMHMGAISNIGTLNLPNFKHLVFNNGAHESVGGQPTLGFKIDIPGIAEASGYTNTMSVSCKASLLAAMEKIKTATGPVLLEIEIRIDSREDLGRPTTTPDENKKSFMKFLTD